MPQPAALRQHLRSAGTPPGGCFATPDWPEDRRRCSNAIAQRLYLGGERLFSYIVSGLGVSSEIALPGLIPDESGSSDADITIRSGAVPLVLEGTTASGPTWQLAGEHFLLTIPGILRMLLIGGREIVFDTLSGVAA